jgi:hypothetical protein
MMAMGSPEIVHGVLASAGDRWSGLRAALQPLAEPAPDVQARLDSLHRLSDGFVAENGNPG